GVSVFVEETSKGTVTDFDGNYSITAEIGQTIKASFMGYTTFSVVYNGENPLNIVLQEDASQLDEIVVIGYGTQKKSNITGSVAVVDMESLPVKSPTTIGQSLQGTAPGVQVVNSGAPGSSPVIRIRGLSSFGNNAPLYVIDGVPASGNADFNPHDVESMQILKDASAASIYGSRAANGVILITTKKGKDKFSIDFDARYGVESVPKKIDVMSSTQVARIDNQGHDNAGIAHSPVSDLVLSDPSKMPSTDWQGYMFQPGAIQDYNLAISTATDKSNYRIALGYLKQDGVIRGPSFERSSLSFSSTHDYGKFQFGSIVRLNYSENRNVVGNPFFDAITAIPSVAIYNKNNVGGFGAGDDVNQVYLTNPVGMQLSNDNRSHTFKTVANLFAEYKFTDYLKYRFTTSVDAASQRYLGKREAAYLRYKDNPISSLTENNANWFDWTFNHMVSFDKTYGDHSISAVGVYSYEGHTERHSSAYGENMAQDGNGNYFWVLAAASENQRVSGSAGENGLHSGIVRVNYGFADRYLFQASGRYDYSSQFSSDNRAAFFPAVSVGWKIDKESFMDNFDNISLLKLRAGYGQLGGKNIGNYDYSGFINSNINYVFGSAQTNTNGATQVKLANENLIWETTESTNIGIDYAFYNNKFQGSVEYYNTNTKDAILPVDLALSTGNYFGNPNQNIGELRNSGWEFSFTYQNMDNEFKYRANLNVSANKNEVVSLGDLGQLAGNMTMTRPGYPIGTFFVRETQGMWQVGEEAEAAKQGAYPGDVHFVDQNDDNVLNDDDRVMFGNPFPKADIGLNLYAEYKGFDVSIFLFSQLGHDIFWGQGSAMERTDDYINHLADMEPWTKENKSNTTPIAMFGAAGARNYYGPQDRYIYDGDYLKLKNLEIGYTLPSDLMEKAGFKKLRVYFSGQNLLTLTNYPGFDPEVVNGWILERGVDWGAYTNPRTISFGVQAKF
ncbi:MAG: TonB-dependent receptor, partial [Flavobacteriales bacterium]|nr:TonB-dependent receptor [Flavobacteriales bacterium]